MSDPTPDEPASEAEDAGASAEESPKDSSPSNRKWFLAIAAVTVLAVGLAGIGLATTSKEETVTREAGIASSVGGALVKGVTSDFFKTTVIGGLVASGVGFAFQYGLKSLISEAGATTESAEALETLNKVNEISNKLDAVSTQLTGIQSQLSQLSVAVAEVKDQVVLGNFEARDDQVQDATRNVKELFDTYQAILCARGVELKVKGVATSGSIYNKGDCPAAASDYEADFKELFNNPGVAGTHVALHELVMGSPAKGVPSILTDFAKMYMGQRRYFSYRDSVAIRNYYTNISEQEALAAYMESEYKVLAGRPGTVFGGAQSVMTDWYNNDRAEQGVIPPMLPLGFVIHMPNGVGPAGTQYPAVAYTAPFTYGTPQTVPKFPNDQSVCGIDCGPATNPLNPTVDAWEPTVKPVNIISDKGTLPIDADHAIGDECATAPGTAVIQGCVEGSTNYKRVMDTWASWGTSKGWRFPNLNDLKALSGDIKPAVFPESNYVDLRTSGNVGQKLGYLASGVPFLDGTSSDRRVAGIQAGFSYPGAVWISETSSIATTGDFDTMRGCYGTWTRHQYVDLNNPVATPTGPRSSDLSLGQALTGSPDEKCALAATTYGNSAGANFLMVRSLTASKGDDFLAQNAMSSVWPVLPPTGPLSVTPVTGNESATVTWDSPATDGGASIYPFYYSVTATPSGGTGATVSCIFQFWLPSPAKCSGLENGVLYTFTVTAMNSELLTASSSATGTPFDPDTTPATSPTTATPDTTPATSPTTPTPDTTPSTAVTVPTRDASKNVEAESFDGLCSGCSGVTIKPNDGFTSGRYIAAISTGDWVRFDGVNTPVGADAKFAVQVASGATTEGTIELHADSPTGELLASVPVSNTGGWHTWTTLTADKQSTLGTKPMYLVFKSGQSGDFVNVDWFKFTA